jgi:hypothetical protein
MIMETMEKHTNLLDAKPISETENTRLDSWSSILEAKPL